jgi:transposase
VDIIKGNGHDTLNLPLYHPDLNPMELVWGVVKDKVAQECLSVNLKEKQVFGKSISAEYAKEKWHNCCKF